MFGSQRRKYFETNLFNSFSCYRCKSVTKQTNGVPEILCAFRASFALEKRHWEGMVFDFTLFNPFCKGES